MKLHPSRISSLGVLAFALVTFTSAGVATASSVPPGDDDEPMFTLPPISDVAPGCAEITTAINAQDSLLVAFLYEDGDGLAAAIATLQADTDAALAAAPPEIADAVATWVAPVPDFLAAVEGVDLADIEALNAALSSVPTDSEASEAADSAVRAWATDVCGFSSLAEQLMGSFETPADPPSCDVIDATIAAEAAGLTVDVSDTDGRATVGLPGYSTSSCSYGNGAMTISTISYNTVDQAIRFFEDNMTDGEFLDTPLGTLPADTTLVTTQAGQLSVTVLDATVPFSVGFPADSVTPEAAVAAAEAVYASLPEVAPMTSEAP